MHRCLDEDTVLAFVEGRLPPDAIRQLEQHVDGCPACAELIEAAACAAHLPAAATSAVPRADDARTPEDSLLFGETLHDAASRSSPDVGLATGLVLGDRYELLDHLGSGGMGAVYAAHDRLLDQAVALKFLRRSLANDPGALNRLRHEVRLAQSVTHVNVARTFTLDESDGHVFIVMELLRGVTLASRLRRGAVDVEEALRISRDVLAGLASAHARGVVHRDIKPANIKLCDDGRVVLFDFGLARAGDLPSGKRNSLRFDLLEVPYQTHSVLCGTPGYIAPEVVSGAAANACSDLYSFGVVLFEMLAGRPPFVANTPTELVRMHVSALPPEIELLRPDVSAVVASTLRQLLQKDPAKRLRTAEETRAALFTARAQRPGVRWTTALALTAAAAVAIVAGGATYSRMRSHVHPIAALGAAAVAPVERAPSPAAMPPPRVEPPAARVETLPSAPVTTSTRRNGAPRKRGAQAAAAKPPVARDSESEAARKRQRLLELEQ